MENPVVIALNGSRHNAVTLAWELAQAELRQAPAVPAASDVAAREAALRHCRLVLVHAGRGAPAFEEIGSVSRRGPRRSSAVMVAHGEHPG
jgi:hypothetical protein